MKGGLSIGNNKNCNFIKIEKRLQNTHREKGPSNKTPALSRSMNMDIWVVGTSNKL